MSELAYAGIGGLITAILGALVAGAVKLWMAFNRTKRTERRDAITDYQSLVTLLQQDRDHCNERLLRLEARCSALEVALASRGIPLPPWTQLTGSTPHAPIGDKDGASASSDPGHSAVSP